MIYRKCQSSVCLLEASATDIWPGNPTRAIRCSSARRITVRQSAKFGIWPARTPSLNFIDDDFVGNPAQRRLFLDRPDRLLVQDRGDTGRLDHRPCDVDRLRGRKALDAGRDVDGLPEIVLPLVEHDREARP